MSFLAGRLAAKEGSFFIHESKLAAGRLAEKLPRSSCAPAPSFCPVGVEESADVLPEILRHSVPIKADAAAPADPSISTASKWTLKGPLPCASFSISPDARNPLRAYISLPQATFGPKRWQLPNEHPTLSASTANELRTDRYQSISPEKLKALAKGYSQIAKAFAVATIIVFGGGTTLFVYTAHKLQIESTEHIRIKGRDLIQPRVDMMREHMEPLRSWAENVSKKMHVEDKGEVKEKPLIKKLSKVLGAGSSY